MTLLAVSSGVHVLPPGVRQIHYYSKATTTGRVYAP